MTQIRVEVLDELGGIASTSIIPDPNGSVDIGVYEAGAKATGFDPPTVTVEVESAGPQGIQGIQGVKGDTGLTGLAVVSHGTDGTVARPSSPLVMWVGAARPVNALATDLWQNA